MKVKVTQSCPTLCDPMDYLVHGILQVRILEWVAYPLLQRIFPTQESNRGLLHCRQILYQLSYQGSPIVQFHIFILYQGIKKELKQMTFSILISEFLITLPSKHQNMPLL